MENNSKVYMYRLKGTNKVYNGQTKQTLRRRAGTQGQRYKYCKKFYNAIQKYGWENFESFILKNNLSQEEANQYEQQMIKLYNSVENGFNITLGGQGYTRTLIQRKELSKRYTGKGNPRYGTHHTEETKRKIGESNKISQLGRKTSEETKRKMSQTHKNLISPWIQCIETGKIYQGYSDASFDLTGDKTKGSHIGEVCKGKRKTAFGYHWKFI